MSLLDAFMEDYIIMEKQRTPDGYGGFVTQWAEGAPIKAAVVMDTTMEARIAESQGVTSVYTVTTSRNINLEYHDIIKHVGSGRIYRITSEGGEKKTPNVTTLDMNQVNAEKWELADG